MTSRIFHTSNPTLSHEEPSSVSLPLASLDSLWFQVSGTRCNLTCHHCFISCSPKNDSFGFLSFESVRQRLKEAESLGVREYYFTGGEPMMNPEMIPILEETLRFGPATVLTNGTIFKESWLERLQALMASTRYSLEFRVSIDGFSPETNDPIRGEGTFQRALRGVQQLVSAGFLPIITAARTWEEEDEPQIIQQFVNVLREAGYDRPRLKLLPRLKMGAEADRTEGYRNDERVTEQMLAEVDPAQFLCHHSRIVTDRGVHVCPLLIEEPKSVMGEKLTDSLGPFALEHGACFTCYQYGAICSNATVYQIEANDPSPSPE